MVRIKSKIGREYSVEAADKDVCIIYDVTDPLDKKLVSVYCGYEDETEENMKCINDYEKGIMG